MGADISALCRESALQALRRVASDPALYVNRVFFSAYHPFRYSFPFVTQQDFHSAMKFLPPSILKGNLVDEIPTTTWDDIGGLEDVKQVCQTSKKLAVLLLSKVLKKRTE